MNKILVTIIIVILSAVLAGCIDEQQVQPVQTHPNQQQQVLASDYKYTISIGSAGQITYNRYFPSQCSIAIGSAGQQAIQGDCNENDFNIIKTQ